MIRVLLGNLYVFDKMIFKISYKNMVKKRILVFDVICILNLDHTWQGFLNKIWTVRMFFLLSLCSDATK